MRLTRYHSDIDAGISSRRQGRIVSATIMTMNTLRLRNGRQSRLFGLLKKRCVKQLVSLKVH